MCIGKTAYANDLTNNIKGVIMEQVQLTLEELYHKRGNYIQTVLRDSNIQDHLGGLLHHATKNIRLQRLRA